jgi:hypothetical protein
MTRDDNYMDYFKKREQDRLKAIEDLITLYPEYEQFIRSRASTFAYIGGKLKIPDHIKKIIKYKENGNMDI